jgi:hypothetical protein
LFQFQPFTAAELAADPRLATLLEDKRHMIRAMQGIVAQHEPSAARDAVANVLQFLGYTERRREREHYAALQAENVRRGWRPSTFDEILGLEPVNAAQDEIEHQQEHDYADDAAKPLPRVIAPVVAPIAAAAEQQDQDQNNEE